VEDLISRDLHALGRLGPEESGIAQLLGSLMNTAEGRRSLLSPDLNLVLPNAMIPLRDLRRQARHDGLFSFGDERFGEETHAKFRFGTPECPLPLSSRALSLIHSVTGMGMQMASVEQAAARFASNPKQKAEIIDAAREFAHGPLDTPTVREFLARLLRIVGPGQALGIAVTLIVAITQVMIASAQSEADAAERAAFQARLLAAISGPQESREASERVVRRRLSIRISADRHASAMGELRTGDVVRVLRTDNDWALIRWSNASRGEIIGWVLAAHLGEIPRPSAGPDD
jgi:hypothetical protein